MSEFEQIVLVSPAFDKRHSNPAKNYGIGACRITFILKGPKGAVQFMIGTDWFLPHTQKENRNWQHDFDIRFDKIKPVGWDVGYHSPISKYEGQTPMESKCDFVTGGTCYYDGSGLLANDWIPHFLAGGTKWLWPKLEDEYRSRLDNSDD